MPATGAGTTQEGYMPQYMLLIFSDPSQGPAEGSPEAEAEFKEWWSYTEALRSANAFVSGDALEPPTTATNPPRPHSGPPANAFGSGAALEPPTTATTLAVRNGDRVVSDGPFADTKEWLGGYYVVE